jgi:vacuolar-type H+-ATPase subunit H
MKKLLKFTAILVIFVLGILILVPLLLKGPIMRKIQQEAGNHIRAELAFEDVSVSLIRNFPNLSLTLHNFSLTGIEDFNGLQLASFESLNLILNLKSILSDDPIDIRQIHLDQANVYLKVLEDGRANWDIVIPDTISEIEDEADDLEESVFAISLRRYSVSNFNLIYEDLADHMFVNIQDLHHSGSGDFTQDLVQLLTETSIASMDVKMDGLNMLSKTTIKSAFEVEINQPDGKITFGDNSISLNDLMLEFSGAITLKETGIDLDIAYRAPQTKFSQLISLIPVFYLQDFAGLDARGSFNLDGFVKGFLPDEGDDLPAFDFNLEVKDGYISYPDLPETIDNLFFVIRMKNPGGTADATSINMPLAKCDVARNPFEARFNLQTPQSDPKFDVMLKSDIELGTFEKLLRESGFDLKGHLKSDLEFAGKLSDFENERYDRVKATGFFELANFHYNDADFPMPVQISEAKANLTPEAMKVSNLVMKIGKSDMQMSGALGNMYTWFFQDTTLRGDFVFSSQMLDLNELMTFAGDENPETIQGGAHSEAPTAPPVIPAALHLEFHAAANQMVYDNLDISDFKGRLTIAQQRITMEQVAMEVLGGRILMAGFYAHDGSESPKVNFDFDLMGLDLDMVFDQVETIQALVPLADAVKGKLTTKFSFQALLEQDMSPNLKTVAALGALRTADLTFQSSTLNEAALKLNYSDLSNMKFRNALLDFQVTDGRIFIKPFALSLGGHPADFSGSHGIDNSLDYLISGKFPLPDLARGSLKLPAGATLQPVDLKVKIGGTFDKPKISFETGNVVSQVTDQVTRMVKDEINKQVDAARDEAKARAEKLIQDAEARGNQLISEAQKTADRIRQEADATGKKGVEAAREAAEKLRQEAGSNPLKQAAANRAGEELIQKAQKEAEKLNREADNRGNELVRQATQQKEHMVNDAKTKAAGI